DWIWQRGFHRWDLHATWMAGARRWFLLPKCRCGNCSQQPAWSHCWKEPNIMPTSSLTQEAAQALRQSPIPALRRLSVSETEKEVVISGCVSSYYFKQLAQETVMPVLHHRELCNQVTVVRN